jgi:hypothetical protein
LASSLDLEVCIFCAGNRTIATVCLLVSDHALDLTVLTSYLGTQRLPRLVGLPKAIEMMLVSSSVSCISEFFTQMGKKG